MIKDQPIPPDAWETIVRHVPIVSVDLVVQQGNGVILGERANEPAKGEWFVPGGTVFKDEPLVDAVHRVAREELGVSITIDRRLGVYEHFWDVADTEDADGKHYIPIAYLVTAHEADFELDGQHRSVRRFTPPFEQDLHPYIRRYLEDAGYPLD